MVTDGERREAAASLRELARHPDSHGDVYYVDVTDSIGMQQGIHDGYVSSESVEHLADLVDRPTWRSVGKEAAMQMLGMFAIALAIATASGMLAGLVKLAASVIANG